MLEITGVSMNSIMFRLVSIFATIVEALVRVNRSPIMIGNNLIGMSHVIRPFFLEIKNGTR